MLDSKFMISILKLKQIEFDLSKLTSRLALYIQSLDLFNIYFNTLIDKRNAKTYHRWPVQGRGSERQCGAKQEPSPKWQEPRKRKLSKTPYPTKWNKSAWVAQNAEVEEEEKKKRVESRGKGWGEDQFKEGGRGTSLAGNYREGDNGRHDWWWSSTWGSDKTGNEAVCTLSPIIELPRAGSCVQFNWLLRIFVLSWI